MAKIMINDPELGEVPVYVDEEAPDSTPELDQAIKDAEPEPDPEIDPARSTS